jgi:hypothetical protein
VSKQIPGAGLIEMVYDKFDRLALSRDANQLARADIWILKMGLRSMVVGISRRL